MCLLVGIPPRSSSPVTAAAPGAPCRRAPPGDLNGRDRSTVTLPRALRHGAIVPGDSANARSGDMRRAWRRVQPPGPRGFPSTASGTPPRVLGRVWRARSSASRRFLQGWRSVANLLERLAEMRPGDRLRERSAVAEQQRLEPALPASDEPCAHRRETVPDKVWSKHLVDEALFRVALDMDDQRHGAELRGPVSRVGRPPSSFFRQSWPRL